MPIPKRWFPKSRDFNDDPEGWELTDTFGDRTVRLWDEICAILDKTENHWRLSGEWLASLSRKVRQSSATVPRAIGWMVAKGWLTIDELSADGSPAVYSSPNYWKYRKKKESKTKSLSPDQGPYKVPSYPNRSEPSLTKPPIVPLKAPAQPSGFAEFWFAYPRKVGKGAAEKAWTKLKPPLTTVLEAIEKQKKQESWTRDGGQFIPHPATWLNQKRWEDEVVVLLPPVKAKAKGNEIDHGDSKSAIGWVAPPSFRIFESQRGKVDNPIPIGKIIDELKLTKP